MKRRLLNLLIAIDQLVYVLLTLGHGSPDETLSAAAYRLWIRRQIGGVNAMEFGGLIGAGRAAEILT